MVPDAPAPLASRPSGIAIHASAVVIDGRALLILGPSGAGKSTLAAMLVAASTPALPIHLLGDDRILLKPAGEAMIARPHPRIAGFIERRGLGIVALDHCPSAPVGGIVALGDVAAPIAALDRPNFPWLQIVRDIEAGERRDRVLAWWRRETAPGASCASHPLSKRASPTESRAKD